MEDFTVVSATQTSSKMALDVHAFFVLVKFLMLVKFQQNRMVQTTRNFESFLTKRKGFQNHFRQIIDTILNDVSVDETII